jgi:hypothetical protein
MLAKYVLFIMLVSFLFNEAYRYFIQTGCTFILWTAWVSRTEAVWAWQIGKGWLLQTPRECKVLPSSSWRVLVDTSLLWVFLCGKPFLPKKRVLVHTYTTVWVSWSRFWWQECVPVLLSDEVELPFQNVIDYTEISIKWPSSKIGPELFQYLESIPGTLSFSLPSYTIAWPCSSENQRFWIFTQRKESRRWSPVGVR